ncbi:MAG TPA: hypothetical protein VFX96_04010 [Pyrinomonadaceae bacterium]|nr:hypothetical protein [Pyrinomonadaceae bacterium]
MSATSVETTVRETVSEAEALVRDFESCALPRERWTHAAHLTVALWYLLHHEWDEAVLLTRRGIRRYNEASGVANTRESGYHETLTIFWLRHVLRFLESHRDDCCDVDRLADELITTADKNLPLEFYTRELLFSFEARARWVEPDLKTL